MIATGAKRQAEPPVLPGGRASNLFEPVRDMATACAATASRLHHAGPQSGSTCQLIAICRHVRMPGGRPYRQS